MHPHYSPPTPSTPSNNTRPTHSRHPSSTLRGLDPHGEAYFDAVRNASRGFDAVGPNGIPLSSHEAQLILEESISRSGSRTGSNTTTGGGIGSSRRAGFSSEQRGGNTSYNTSHTSNMRSSYLPPTPRDTPQAGNRLSSGRTMSQTRALAAKMVADREDSSPETSDSGSRMTAIPGANYVSASTSYRSGSGLYPTSGGSGGGRNLLASGSWNSSARGETQSRYGSDASIAMDIDRVGRSRSRERIEAYSSGSYGIKSPSNRNVGILSRNYTAGGGGEMGGSEGRNTTSASSNLQRPQAIRPFKSDDYRTISGLAAHSPTSRSNWKQTTGARADLLQSHSGYKSSASPPASLLSTPHRPIPNPSLTINVPTRSASPIRISGFDYPGRVPTPLPPVGPFGTLQTPTRSLAPGSGYFGQTPPLSPGSREKEERERRMNDLLMRDSFNSGSGGRDELDEYELRMREMERKRKSSTWYGAGTGNGKGKEGGGTGEEDRGRSAARR